MSETLRQAAAAATGALLVILVVAIAGWISKGVLIRVLGGTNQAQLEEVRAALEALSDRTTEPATPLDKAIVLTDRECATLGKNWKPYEGMSGRFPLGSGSHTDPNDDKQAFVIGDKSYGTYSHRLTELEMPSHTHSFVGSRGSRSVDDWDNEWGYREHRRTTGSTGGNQPHNNMPPYRVVNFCHLVTSEGG